MRMLVYGTPGDAKDECLRIGESGVVESMYKFCEEVVAVIGPYYLGKMKKIQLASWHQINLEDFLEWSKGSIACAGPGRTAHFLGREYTKGTKDIVVWCSKLWPILILNLALIFLAWRVHTIISMCKGYYLADGI
jgi:hypothetical protein